MPLLKDPVAYFWSKVNRTNSCWLWTGYRKNGRYGNIKVKGVAYQASVFSYMLRHSLTEKPTLNVLHSCDMPACVRPDHLFLGTQKDNYDDMVRKGRDANLRSEETRKKLWANRSRRPEDHYNFGKPIREHVKHAMHKAVKEYWRNPANRERQSKLAIERNKNRERRADGTFAKVNQ